MMDALLQRYVRSTHERFLMSASTTSPVLVMGATGKQGGAVVRALRKAGRPVRAFVRDPASPAARALAADGVDVVQGEFTDTASLDAALAGVDGVFSVQMGSHPGDPETEILAGKALVEAAHRANVRVFVQSSVARAGDHENFAGWDAGRWEPLYWQNKAAVIAMVKAQGFPHWVILKPALIMENLVPPMVEMMYPALAARGRFETAIAPDTRLDWIAAQDIGAFAAAAFADPARFHGHEIDLAADALTLPEVAARMADATGKPVSAVTLSEEETLAKPHGAMTFQHESWNNVEGYKVDLAAVRRWGVPLTTLDQFIQQHRDKFVIG
jgi:uncharacterized protein YbjT (DUF2867 family)